jgi:hypothetical protein
VFSPYYSILGFDSAVLSVVIDVSEEYATVLPAFGVEGMGLN